MNKDLLKKSGKTIHELINNIIKINHILSMKSYEDIYPIGNRNADNVKKYSKAVSIGFFLNLKKSKYPPDVWVKFINVPENI